MSSLQRDSLNKMDLEFAGETESVEVGRLESRSPWAVPAVWSYEQISGDGTKAGRIMNTLSSTGLGKMIGVPDHPCKANCQ